MLQSFLVIKLFSNNIKFSLIRPVLPTGLIINTPYEAQSILEYLIMNMQKKIFIMSCALSLTIHTHCFWSSISAVTQTLGATSISKKTFGITGIAAGVIYACYKTYDYYVSQPTISKVIEEAHAFSEQELQILASMANLERSLKKALEAIEQEDQLSI